MLEALRERWQYPDWADARYKRLAWLDAVLAGELFKDLKGDFFDESLSLGTGRKAKLSDRKPSVRYNIAGQVARNTARKLFSGRHAPRFTHPDNEKLALVAEALMREGFLKTRILQAVNWGSVGSVGITFCLKEGGEGVPRIVFNVYRARMCTPSIDSLGELRSLRLWYVISSVEAAKLSSTDYLGKNIYPESKYCFVRDFLAGREVTYVPVEVGSRIDDKDLDALIQTMDFGDKILPNLNFLFEPQIVPAHWFLNLAGGEYPDGACTWEDAVPGMIDIAFTLSNLGRGVRYNSTPQLVIRGATRKSREPYAPGNTGISRDSAEVIRVSAGMEKPGAEKEGPGDAKLLEMRGNSVKAALEYCNAVRKYSLEQIGASRKDPDRLHFPQSGKAMELLDEDFFDLVGELRTCYGEYGLIPLMKKAITVAAAAKHPLLAGVSLADLDGLALKWPRPYQPTAQEFYLYMQGLSVGVNGKQGAQKPADGAQPSVPAQGVITREEAHALLDSFLDMPAQTSTVALQQQPRREESPHTDPAKDGKTGTDDPLTVQPQGKTLPPKTTSLAPPEYHQQ